MEEGGIYILITSGKNGGSEYRVVHAYNMRGITGKDSSGAGDESINKTAVKKIFGGCKVFVDKMSADAYADRMYYRYEMSDPFLVAAGINSITLGRDFSYYGGKKNVSKKEEGKGKAGKKIGKTVKGSTEKNR